MSKTTLSVRGMSCPSCIAHITDALAVPGVRAVDVKLERRAVTIEHDTTVSVDQLVAALRGAGYEATPAGLAQPMPRSCCS